MQGAAPPILPKVATKSHPLRNTHNGTRPRTSRSLPISATGGDIGPRFLIPSFLSKPSTLTSGTLRATLQSWQLGPCVWTAGCVLGRGKGKKEGGVERGRGTVRMVTCRNGPRQKLSPCVDGEAGGAVSGQIVFCLCLLFSASASASRSRPPPGAPSPPLTPGPASDPTEDSGAGSRRARTPSEAHIALYRERIRRSCALMSTPSSSGRGFVRGKRSIRESSADAWWAARLWGEREREENADQRRGPVKGAWAVQ